MRHNSTMNRKRNVLFSKPEDPEFLKVLKKQAGYDDKNHKFDEPQNDEEDFVDDEDSEKPQVVVLKEGDLTAEEAELEQQRIDTLVTETKADLTQRVLFKSKHKSAPPTEQPISKKHKKIDSESKKLHKKSRQLLSFGGEDEEDEED